MAWLLPQELCLSELDVFPYLYFFPLETGGFCPEGATGGKPKAGSWGSELEGLNAVLGEALPPPCRGVSLLLPVNT